MHKHITAAMNEWEFIGQETFVGIGKSATINNFKYSCGMVVEEREVICKPHSS